MNMLSLEKPGERWVMLLSQALEKGWKTYRAELKRCRMEFSNEAVHDLRVATRRIVAIIQLLNSIAPRPRLRKIIRTFKEELDELDELRDTQVILEEISGSIEELPQLHGFQNQLQHVEEQLLSRLPKKLKKFKSEDLKRRIRQVQDALEAESAEGFERLVLQAADDAYESAWQRLNLVDAARPSTIHRVRIAFKSFRYMVEIIHPLLDAFPAEQLKRMHDYQTKMGEVQDAEVFLQTLKDYAENASFTDLEPVRRYYERRHAEAIAAYIEDMNQLHSFWRSAPDKAFPWETKT